MLKQIVVMLSPEDDKASWALLDENHLLIQVTEMQSLSELAKTTSQETEIILITTPYLVSLHQVKMPKLSRNKLLNALPFALEENLLSDPTDLHFAISTQDESGYLPLAIISKSDLETQLQKLEEVGLQASSCISPLFALPYREEEWSLAIVEDAGLARTGLYQGFSADLSNFETILAWQLETAAVKPKLIQIVNYTEKKLNLQIAGISITEKSKRKNAWLPDASLAFQNAPYINLLQDAFRSKQKASNHQRTWMFAGFALALWVGLVVLSNLVSYFILKHSEKQLATQIEAIYAENFPHASSMVAPKERMQDKLNSLLSFGNKNPFLLWLGKVASTKANFKEIKLTQIDYHNGQLNLGLSADAFSTLDHFTQALTKAGLKVKQENVGKTSETQVKANLIIAGGVS